MQRDLLFKWFLDLNIDDPAFAARFMQAVLEEAGRRRLLSEEHFTVDGTLLEAWASLKSVRPKDEQDPPAGGGRNPDRDFHGERRVNDTHASTDPSGEGLSTKSTGQAAKLSYLAHILMENRGGLLLDILVTQASGTAERDGAITMLKRRRGIHRRVLPGKDRGRQGLRHEGLREAVPGTGRDPSRSAQPQRPPQGRD